MVLDDTLINEDACGPVSDIDEDRIVRSIDRVNDESVGGRTKIEQKIRVFVCEIGGGAVQVADDTRINGRFGGKDSVIGGRIDVVGFEVEIVEG